MNFFKHQNWNKLYLLLLLVSCYSFAQAQYTLVLNGGITVLNGGTAGTPVYLVINESTTTGIKRVGGHINSENQYNFVKWMAGTGTGNYVFPFGVGGNTANYIPFTFNKTTAGNSNIDMATWATNITNMPHAAATNVGAVTNMFGTADSVLYALDRFWDIQTSAAVTADLTFSYLGTENTTSNPTDTVKTQHWNGSSWDTQVGPGNLGVTTGVGTAGPFVGQTTFSPWILSIIPNCPTAVISYASNYCSNDTTPQAVTFAGGLGGWFSATPAGLSIDSLTGAIIPANSTPGTYMVTYTIDSTLTCPIFEATTTVTINTPAAGTTTANICLGDSILLGGSYQTVAGAYKDTLVSYLGCDSVLTTTLTVNPIITSTAALTICMGDSTLLGGSYQNTSGIYNDTLTTTTGCDSVLMTTLTVNPIITSPATISICTGDSTFLGGSYQNTSGVYNDTLITATGCDSVLMTTLLVNSFILSTSTSTICMGDSILLGGSYQNTSGAYVDTLISYLGCDSVLTTTLTVNPIITSTAAVSICAGDSTLLGGSYQNTSGVYNDTLTTATGCDSVLMTTLTVNPMITSTAAVSICIGDSTFLGGSYQNTTGAYLDTLISSLGCDSILTTTLTVNPKPIVATSTDTTVCGGGTVTISATGGITYNWDNGLGAGQNQTVNPIASTTYIVTVTDNNNCSDTGSVNVFVIQKTIADAGIDQNQCDNISSFTLNGNIPLITGETGLWTSVGQGIVATPSVPTSAVTGLATGTNIFVWTIVSTSCPPSLDTVIINITNCDPPSIIIPNVFTPNGDGSNDVFTVVGVNLISVEGEIWNRWGEKMFAWDNIDGYWDGRTLAGKEAPDGTYFVIIKAKGNDGTDFFQKGTVSLIR